MNAIQTKICPKCKVEKTFDLFYKNRNNKNNLSPYCKICSNLRTTSYARENKDKIPTTGYSLKRRYGISSEDYLNLLNFQDNKCAICETDKCSSGRNFAVDHCHETGKIRGLLCSNCNTGIGQLQDSVEILNKAIKYLNNNKGIDGRK